MTLRVCIKCGTEKDLELFEQNHGQKTKVCKACASKRITAYRKEAIPVEERNLQVRLSKERHPEKAALLDKITKIAMRRLRDLYRDEYDRMLEQVRKEHGLGPSQRLKMVPRAHHEHPPL